MSPSGKARGSGPRIRGFESLHPSQNKNDPSGRFYFGSEGIELPNDFCFSKRFGGFGVANETKESTEGIFFRK